MKTASVRDLRNSFARISRWLEAGETVEVTKRGRAFARIVPAMEGKKKRQLLNRISWPGCEKILVTY
jgi:antitoxin (DNA-binding transcriptional repressor) of toxin-antitoxin stability system